MISRKQIEHDVLSQNRLEEVLPQALNMMSSDYYTYSSLQFTMNFYNYYEMTIEQPISEIDAIFSTVDSLAKKSIFTTFDGKVWEEVIGEIDHLRNEIIKVMQLMTELADELSIYEYVLNRIEKNYEDELCDIDNDAVTKDIMQSIFSDNDQMLINSRLRSMLSQLPVRMTKRKFLDMLHDSLSIYEGSDKSSVDDYLYMLLCAMGLIRKERAGEEEPKSVSIEALYDSLEYLEKLDMTMLTREEFKDAQDILRLAVEKIKSATDRYFSLQEVVNAFYCLLLNQPYASIEADKEVQPLKEITLAISKALSEASKESLSDETVELFQYTEGKLELYIQYLSKDEGILEGIETINKDFIASSMLTQQLSGLSLSKLLTSNSVFINLHSNAENKKADKAYLELQYEDLILKICKALECHNKLHNRAMIAAALREMPVLFHSMDEVRDYIKNSLSGCHDVAEKLTSIELFLSAIE